MRVNAWAVLCHRDVVGLVEEGLVVPPLREVADTARRVRTEEDPDQSTCGDDEPVVPGRIGLRPDDELAALQRRVVRVHTDPGERGRAGRVADMAAEDEATREIGVDPRDVGERADRVRCLEARLVVPPLPEIARAWRRPAEDPELDLHRAAGWDREPVVT